MGLALDPSHWGLLILTGAFIGLGFGLFGRAGELAIAPALLAVLPECGVPAAAVPKLAAATAIAILIPVTVAHSEGAIRRQAIDWDLFLLLAPSTAVGAVPITTFGDSLSGGLLNFLIIVGIAILALRLFWTSRGPAREIPPPDTPPLIAMTLKAVAGSAGAAAIGVSGGLVIAPMLEKHLAAERAAATASALTLPFALAATLGYFLSPSPDSCGPACGGAIFLPALAATGMAAVLTAPLAATARHFLPQPAASRLFAVFIIASACLFALPVQTIPDLLASSRDSALEAVLTPLCDPEPAPAAPAFEGAVNSSNRASESAGMAFFP
ncbi:MAG: TSUP family transporter [Rhodomicrobium sp.]